MVLGWLIGELRRGPNANNEAKTDESAVGYFQVDQSNDQDLPELSPGLVLDRGTDEPPWFMVRHDLVAVSIPDWPLKLWKVEATRPIKPQGHSGNYIRCRAITVLDEVPAFKVFGEEDRGIVDIINFAAGLSKPQAAVLSGKRSPRASQLVNKGWREWLRLTGETTAQDDADFDDVLRLGGQNGGSPVGPGLTVVWKVVFDRAGQVDPAAAHMHGDDGAVFMAEPWNSACSALKDAVMSFGASHLFKPTEHRELRRPLFEVAPDFARRLEEKQP